MTAKDVDLMCGGIDPFEAFERVVLPNVRLLSEFCANVTFDDAGQDA